MEVRIACELRNSMKICCRLCFSTELRQFWTGTQASLVVEPSPNKKDMTEFWGNIPCPWLNIEKIWNQPANYHLDCFTSNRRGKNTALEIDDRRIFFQYVFSWKLGFSDFPGHLNFQGHLTLTIYQTSEFDSEPTPPGPFFSGSFCPTAQVTGRMWQSGDVSYTLKLRRDPQIFARILAEILRNLPNI